MQPTKYSIDGNNCSMKRKTFLKIAGVAGVIATIGTVKFFSTSFENAVVALLEDQLHFLNLDKNGLQQFARDFSKRQRSTEQLIIKAYGMAGVKATQSQRMHSLISTYLLSTDFFTNKMDEAKTVKYLGLYNPYLRPCAHPFSHFYYS
jgi:hypothetical protein